LTTANLNPDLGRWVIGMDHLFNTLESWANTSANTRNNYPPFNMIYHNEERQSIEIAVAGFGEQDLTVTVSDGVLNVVGEIQETGSSEAVYLHRGLSRRRFSHKWRLLDYMEVVGATVKDGILTIDLERRLPDALKPRTVAINFVR
jgi:molecular chaperone IbpA